MAPRTALRAATGNTHEESTPITIDPTDSGTLASNNSGGPSLPSSTDGESASVLLGTDTDWDGPITKAQLQRVIARRGRTVGELLTEREISLITECINAITDVPEDNTYRTADDELSFKFRCINRQFKTFKTQLEEAANDAAGDLKLTFDYNKAKSSPNTATTKAADGDKELHYTVTIGRVEYTVPPATADDSE